MGRGTDIMASGTGSDERAGRESESGSQVCSLYLASPISFICFP